MKPKTCIILGGGASIKTELQKLPPYLNNSFVIGCNYAFRYLPTTFTAFVDRNFYSPNDTQYNPDIIEEIKLQKLLIGQKGTVPNLQSNTILVPGGTDLDKISEEFYVGGLKNMPKLCGIFALSLACYLLRFEGIVYLLGYDFTTTPKTPTHFYSDISHYGIGRYETFRNAEAGVLFRPFERYKNIHINNVGLNSNIPNFNKISYEQFYKEQPIFEDISQDNLRWYCMGALGGYDATTVRN